MFKRILTLGTLLIVNQTNCQPTMRRIAKPVSMAAMRSLNKQQARLLEESKRQTKLLEKIKKDSYVLSIAGGFYIGSQLGHMIFSVYK